MLLSLTTKEERKEFLQVNCIAIGLSTVLAFVLGMLWYSPPLFVNVRMTGHGYTEEDFGGCRRG